MLMITKSSHQKAAEKYNKKIIKLNCSKIEDKAYIIKLATQAKLSPSAFIKKIVYGSLKMDL